MGKYTPIDWQSFSLKKDIEIIVKKLQNHNRIQFSLIWEIVLAIFGVALSNIFKDINKHQLFWIILLVVTCIPFLVFAIIEIVKWINKKRKEKDSSFDQKNIRDFIDNFDNEIAYYILMSESFYTMLMEAISDKSNQIDKNIIHFYYIQASYYFKKAIYDLAPLHNIADKVLSNKPEKIKTKRLISYSRYYNASNLLTSIYNYIDANKNLLDDLKDGDIIVKLNNDFKIILNSLNDAISASLNGMENKQIIIITTAHIEQGELNSSELYKILVKINPEIIFEELFFIRTKENILKYNINSIENSAIEKYMDEYKVAHVSVDYNFLKNIKKKDIELMYEKLKNSSEKYLTLIRNYNFSISKKGLKYTNSDEFLGILDEAKSIEKEIINNLNDKKLMRIYNLWEKINEKRENKMVNTIYQYSKKNVYKNAVFIFGASHKKSILQKIKDYENKYKIEINWKLYDFEKYYNF